MGAGGSQPPPQSMKNQPTRGSQFAPTIGGRGKSFVNIADEINKDENKRFAEGMLKTLNEFRARHKSPPLKLNRKLCLLAQEWAERISKLGTADSRPSNFQYGQNLYYSRWATDPASVCKSWYKEGNRYQYDKEPNPPPVTNVNFTQMIWKSTTDVGVGIASSWSNVTYIVVNYKPKGNVRGEYKKNLLPPAALLEKEDEAAKRRISEGDRIPSHIERELKRISSVNLGFYQKKMLQLINEFRDVHSSKPLKMSSMLTELAQKHAERMAALRKVVPFEGKVTPPIGASYYCSKWYTEPKDACQFWYSENKRYKYVEPTIVSLSTVNFVQMVWANTKEVGFGRAEADGYVYVTAFYRPAGNILGEFKKNIKPFRVSSNMTATPSDIQGSAKKGKAVSIVLPAI